MRFPKLSGFSIVLWVFLGLALIGLGNAIRTKSPEAPGATTIAYSDFYKKLHSKQIIAAEFDPMTGMVSATEFRPAKDGKPEESERIRSRVPEGMMAADWMRPLLEAGVRVEIKQTPPPSRWSTWGVMLLPTLLIIAVFIWIQRRNEKLQGRGMMQGFNKSRQNRIDPAQNPFRLKDVEGIEDAKADIEEIVNYLKDASDYQKVGARSPKGVLLSGPPGAGKTLLAKAMAGEAGVPFFNAAGSDFVEMFVGVGASRVRDLFNEARESGSSAIIFIDEIDAVGRQRGHGQQGSHEEREQTLNALLTEMDGFSSGSGIVVIAATNRPDILDSALRRPGRFDRDVVVSLPDVEGRARILALHGKKIPMAADVDWQVIARATPGFSGAELENLINEAALRTAREKRSLVTKEDFDAARDKILMGNPRAGIRNAFERRATAVHEAGHAVVARFVPESDPVHKITILPRGKALGLTMQLPEGDVYNYSRQNLQSRIAVLMGGRAAEETVMDLQSVGASNDFARATQLARQMIGAWGMGDLGPVSFDGEHGAHTQWWSDAVRLKVDESVMALLREQHTLAQKILREQRALLDAVTDALLDHDTVDAAEFEALVRQYAPDAPAPSTADTLVPADEAVLPNVQRDPQAPTSMPAPAAQVATAPNEAPMQRIQLGKRS